jgi:pyruvate kinase
MALPRNKTKIVATIGPASDSSEMLERLTRAGLNVARLNFSHGDRTGRCVAIMADHLPGTKIGIGRIEPESVQLHAGENFIPTVEEIVGSPERVSVSFKDLPGVVKRGDRFLLNDGLVQLTVERVAGREVHCKVSVGGEL